MSEEKNNGTADKEQRVRELAAKPDLKKPDDIRDGDWRSARIAAGHMVIIRSHFKSIFLVPLALISLICGIGTSLGGSDPTTGMAHFWGLLWVFSFTFYISIFIFEWNRAWTVVMMGGVVSVVCLGFAVNSTDFPVFRKIFEALKDFEFGLNQQAYFFFAIFFGFCSGISWLKTRLNYVVVEHNEMQFYRNAFFGDRERISMMNPRIEVKVPDMIEFFHPFYRAGTVVIHHGHGKDMTIVLENVLNIRKIERVTDRLGSTLRVSIETDNSAN